MAAKQPVEWKSMEAHGLRDEPPRSDSVARPRRPMEMHTPERSDWSILERTHSLQLAGPRSNAGARDCSRAKEDKKPRKQSHFFLKATRRDDKQKAGSDGQRRNLKEILAERVRSLLKPYQLDGQFRNNSELYKDVARGATRQAYAQLQTCTPVDNDSLAEYKLQAVVDSHLQRVGIIGVSKSV